VLCTESCYTYNIHTYIIIIFFIILLNIVAFVASLQYTRLIVHFDLEQMLLILS